MESIPPVFAVIAGLAIRLAIPIIITAIAIHFLRRLDRRWQAEAEEQLLLPAVEKPQCWDIKGCSEEMKAKCEGYRSDQPCWQAFREENGYLKEYCLGCEVFRTAPIPTHV